MINYKNKFIFLKLAATKITRKFNLMNNFWIMMCFKLSMIEKQQIIDDYR